MYTPKIRKGTSSIFRIILKDTLFLISKANERVRYKKRRT